MSLFPADVLRLAEETLAACRARGLKVATAESCTGGLVAGCLTAIAGSSDVIECGFVTYANRAKQDLLGVSAATLARVGAVSEEVARAMAEGALAHGRAEASVSATGIAGPGGGSAEKPVGLVHIAAAREGFPTLHERLVLPGDREAVRMATVAAALRLLKRQAEA